MALCFIEKPSAGVSYQKMHAAVRKHLGLIPRNKQAYCWIQRNLVQNGQKYEINKWFHGFYDQQEYKFKRKVE